MTDSKRATRSGGFKEILGTYDPRAFKGKIDNLNSERIKYWLSQGANPTDTVHNLLVKHQIIKAKKIDVSAVSKKAPVAKESDTIEQAAEKEPI